MLGCRTDLHIFDAGSVNGTRYCSEILLPYVRLFRGAMGLQFLFMEDNAPCHRTVASEQLLERLAARTLPPVTIRELRLALQDEWAAMPQQLIDTLLLSMGRRCETSLAVRGGHIPLLKTGCFLQDTHPRDVSAFSRVALHATFSIKLLFIPLISLLSFFQFGGLSKTKAMAPDEEYLLKYGDPRIKAYPLMDNSQINLCVIAVYFLFVKFIDSIVKRDSSVNKTWSHDHILFTDESRFSLNTDSCSTFTWREPGILYLPYNIREIDSYGAGGLMVRAGIMLDGRAPHHVFERGSVTGVRHRDEVLEKYVRLFRGAMWP
ncbi:transposable element Tcb2 transposase [Trichonephila clavipes]|nr:transposable element Tcb2 transposase [Trichonephila clavipes]